MVCHWPGIYYNGDKVGFNILKEIKKRLDQKYDNLNWMKLSEIARYWAAKELTSVSSTRNTIILKAPFSAPGFTIKVNTSVHNPRIENQGEEMKPLMLVKSKKNLKSNTWYSDKTESVVCFDLEKGTNELIMS